MKKMLSVLLIAAMMLILFACAEKGSEEPVIIETEPVTTYEEVETIDPAVNDIESFSITPITYEQTVYDDNNLTISVLGTEWNYDEEWWNENVISFYVKNKLDKNLTIKSDAMCIDALSVGLKEFKWDVPGKSDMTLQYSLDNDLLIDMGIQNYSTLHLAFSVKDKSGEIDYTTELCPITVNADGRPAEFPTVTESIIDPTNSVEIGLTSIDSNEYTHTETFLIRNMSDTCLNISTTHFKIDMIEYDTLSAVTIFPGTYGLMQIRTTANETNDILPIDKFTSINFVIADSVTKEVISELVFS